MTPLNFKIDRDLLNMLLLKRNEYWALHDEMECIAILRDNPDEPVDIRLTYPRPWICNQIFVDDSILVDDDLNCYKWNYSKNPDFLIKKLKDGSLKDELKSNILKYGLDYTFKDLNDEIKKERS